LPDGSRDFGDRDWRKAHHNAPNRLREKTNFTSRLNLFAPFKSLAQK
jgi:hypothetical protein